MGDDPKGWKKVAGQIAYRDKSYRDLAKMLEHGSNYGGLPPTMAGHTKSPRVVVFDFQKRYFAFPAWSSGRRKRSAFETTRTLRTTSAAASADSGRPVRERSPQRRNRLSSQSSTTGEFINRGASNLGTTQPRQGFSHPVSFSRSIDSLVFLVPMSRLRELIPIMMQKPPVKLILARGREFTMPLHLPGWFGGWIRASRQARPQLLVAAARTSQAASSPSAISKMPEHAARRAPLKEIECPGS